MSGRPEGAGSGVDAMLLRIQHETRLSYSAHVSETVFEVRMAPPSDEDQTALSYRLRIAPQAPVTSYRDGFGNRVDLFNVATPYRELVIAATSFVRAHRRCGRDRLARASWPGAGPVEVEAAEFLQPSPLVDRSEALDSVVASLGVPSGSLAEVVGRIMEAVAARLTYEKKVTTARTRVGEALELGRGVCQDFAHLFIGICRGLGLPARYVSGYINHPGEIATHAWCQVWGGGGVGWIDFDPSHDDHAGDDYVVVAIGRDYSDVPPNRGVWAGRAEETMTVSVQVEPVDRVPMEWNEWAPPPFRRGAGASSSQRQNGGSSQVQRQAYPAYPNQKTRGAILRQQQGQQQ
jgi:transglutaminase-like putative cysteine protease